jgi:serine/threonine protein kinase
MSHGFPLSIEHSPLVHALPEFETERTVHQGSLEKVVVARSHFTGQPHLMHVLRPEHQYQATAIDQFLRNAAQYQALDHACLPTYQAVSESEGGQLRLLTEPLQGVTLAHHLRTHGPLSRSAWAWIERQLVDALFYLQSRGIFRCQIDATRIFLAAQADVLRPVLIDFGFAWPDRLPGESLSELVEEAFFAEPAGWVE